MATSYPFSPIVTRNLILCLDSVNPKSYTSGSTFTDISGFDNNFSLANAQSFSLALVFDGATNYGTASYNNNFNLSSASATSFTIEGYFTSNSYTSSQCLVSKDTYGVNFDWGLVINDSNTLIFYSNGTATNVTATVPTMVPGQWYHYVVTCAFDQGNSNIRIYLNGILYTGPTVMSVSNSSQVALTVGALGGLSQQSYYLNGKLSTVRIYRSRLTDSEVIQNYNSLKNRFS